tara:strand:+ start:394 stop:594 length:201 start_codon:yes stop_codon:yes gene_type:complete
MTEEKTPSLAPPISETAASDLFFNHDFEPEGSDPEAVMQRARSFASAYHELGFDAQWYFDDFMKRV